MLLSTLKKQSILSCLGEFEEYIKADLIVSVVPDLHLIQTIPCQYGLPLFPWYEGRSIHGPTVTNDETISVGALGQVEESILNLKHGPQQVFLKKPKLFCQNLSWQINSKNNSAFKRFYNRMR